MIRAICRRLLVDGLHRGEQQNIADGGAVGEQHDQAVHAKAQAARGGQTVLQSVDVIVIHLSLAVGLNGLALGDLTLKTALLVDGVVQLAEGVAVLGAVDEVLKALGKGGIIRLALGKRTDLHGVVVDKGGLDQLVLNKGIEELGQNGTLGGNLGQLHMMLLGRGNGILVGLPVVEVHAGILLDSLDHSQALPVTHIDLLALIRDDHAAADLEGQALVQLLHQIHHAVEIGKGLIQLDAGEFGVVLGVHALVAEDAANLIHAVHAAHDQALEVQLGLDAQHHVHVQAVVMGVEGTGGGTDLKGGQDGGIHLQEALLVQIGADLLQDLAALDEGVLYLRVGDQVHIALTVTHLGIGQAVELLGQGAQIGRAHV